LFETCDALITPTVAHLPFPVERRGLEGAANYMDWLAQVYLISQ
jgi:Asp-tRNA(Asn)/Glu-tRNA(Gln) amidotransferase A subunit family amidase